MAEKTQFKLQGVHFARSLQVLMKMVNLFSVDHTSAAGILRRTYDSLNPLLKQVRYLTIGFVEQRVLLNNILTADNSLKPLENEFLKRGIGAISFDAGITFAAFTRAIDAISVNPKTIQENGGLMPFLESKQLEFVRVFPAARNEIRNEEGDTVLEMGSEEYLISKALSNIHSVPMHGIEGILSRMEEGGTGGNFGEASGPGGGNGLGTGAGGVGIRMGGGGNGRIGGNAGTGSGSGLGMGTGGGEGPGGIASPAGGGSVAVPGNSGAVNGSSLAGMTVDDLQRIADQKFEASLRNPQEDPQKAYVDLSRILSNLRPDGVMRKLSENLAAEDSREEVTAEVFEDSALRWALRRLAAIPTGGDALIVEEQIFRVLMRSLQATHAASRLAEKLADFAKDYVLPKKTLQRLQEEVRWLSLTSHAKLRELLSIEHFTPSEFRRALDLIKDLIRMGSAEGAEALGVQYFSIFDDHGSIRIEEVGRIPELLRTLAGIQGEFWLIAEDRLIQALASARLNRVIHVQVVNALVALARIAATYENFHVVRRVGAALERSAASDLSSHDPCCRPALSLMLQTAAVDRIAEMYLDRRHDTEWTRTATMLLRWAAPSAIERLFARLDIEPITSNRLALIRLLGRVGPIGLAAARQRLKRPEWYIVRNACKILSELKDPELFEQLETVLSHPDERVQKAALQAVKDSKLAGRNLLLAKGLPSLPPTLLEIALDELAYHPHPDILPFVEEFLSAPVRGGVKVIRRAVDLVASIADARAEETLARVAMNNELDAAVRKVALDALGRRPGHDLRGSVGVDYPNLTGTD
ncbi:MAG TPA: hypothetical protein VKW06_16900 [Candidatus Angelobacter sp.]|nr:hypothetical protein [Candidatus Angelobacter sp.]